MASEHEQAGVSAGETVTIEELKSQLAAAQQYGRTEYGIECLLREDLASVRRELSEMRKALRDLLKFEWVISATWGGIQDHADRQRVVVRAERVHKGDI